MPLVPQVRILPGAPFDQRKQVSMQHSCNWPDSTQEDRAGISHRDRTVPLRDEAAERAATGIQRAPRLGNYRGAGDQRAADKM